MDLYRTKRCVSNWSRKGGARAFGRSSWAFLGLFSVAIAYPAMAQTNLVTNGSFAITGGTTSAQMGPGGALCTSNNTSCTSTESVAGWSTGSFSSSYNFVYLPYSTSNPNAINGSGYSGTVTLWSPLSNPSSANGFTNTSPTGGNFLASDSDYLTTAVTQTVNNLVVGKTYAVSFVWAAAQQEGSSFTAASQDDWQVTLGGTTQTTPIQAIAGKGFSGWATQTFDYVATSSSEVLSFLASGESTSGLPSFALLANVSVTQVPEPATWALMLTGLASLVVVVRRRRLPAPSVTNAI